MYKLPELPEGMPETMAESTLILLGQEAINSRNLTCFQHGTYQKKHICTTGNSSLMVYLNVYLAGKHGKHNKPHSISLIRSEHRVPHNTYLKYRNIT